MELEIINEQGEKKSQLHVSKILFGRVFNEALIHQVIVAYQANSRQGTRSQKNREIVKHSTAKPFKQKGTGRARAGMSSSPLWRGGGRAFPNLPFENFKQKINKKMYKAAICSIFSKLVLENRLKVIDSFSFSSHKTNLFNQKIKSMNFDSILVIVDSFDKNTYLSCRNIPNVLVLCVDEIDPVSLISFKKVALTQKAVAMIEEIFG